ncbi:hypothetical protein N7516_001766 [Penicillium verrucosum]|uniref:uncharacterized protein n=1 Tax=Penicillium verrucosum TaxID=60171 RepID=UPI0025453A47|nr:uncharacterized protein N7516_001766 [Penicillium verrucosum]KAJ5941598.1 hypothetical protein N7516_001766 [Penicillium verrucosum]
MGNLSSQTALGQLQDRERLLRRRELDLDLEKHEFSLQKQKMEIEKQGLEIEQNKFNLAKYECEIKERIEKLQDVENEFDLNGPDIIRRAISKKFQSGMVDTIEEKLKQGRDMNALQRHRYERHVYEQDLEGKEDRLADFLDVETKLGEIAQREICLMEQYKNDPEKFENEVKATTKEYKRFEHEWQMIRQSFDGPLERAFEYWRSNPKWYMHRVLREDCARMGGCCGRDCGCCLHRKPYEIGSPVVGHCTVECGCCKKARGFELSEDDKEYFAMRYAVSEDGKKGLDLKDLQLKSFGMQNQHLQEALTKEAMKENLVRYEFSDGAVEEFERYMNEDDTMDDDEAEFTDDECPPDEREDPYYRRICLASIWGLVDGNFENPFDLIDEAPICDPAWQFVGGKLVAQEENDSVMSETVW